MKSRRSARYAYKTAFHNDLLPGGLADN